jgi:DNA polymerase III alpha subunit
MGFGISEQIMSAVMELAGYTAAESDSFRKPFPRRKRLISKSIERNLFPAALKTGLKKQPPKKFLKIGNNLRITVSTKVMRPIMEF